MTSTTPKISMPILPGERLSFWSSMVCDAVAMVVPQVVATIRKDCYGSMNVEQWWCLKCVSGTTRAVGMVLKPLNTEDTGLHRVSRGTSSPVEEALFTIGDSSALVQNPCGTKHTLELSNHLEPSNHKPHAPA